MNNIIYIVGLVVVVIAVAGFFGLRQGNRRRRIAVDASTEPHWKFASIIAASTRVCAARCASSPRAPSSW